MDRIANRSRGFAFLRYATVEESQKAIEGMHGKVRSEDLFVKKNIRFCFCRTYKRMIFFLDLTLSGKRSKDTCNLQ